MRTTSPVPSVRNAPGTASHEDVLTPDGRESRAERVVRTAAIVTALRRERIARLF